MIEDDRHAARCRAHDSAGARRVTAGRADCFGPIAGLALVGMALAGLGGCTFVEQTEDLIGGGPTQRVESAKQRQSDAVDVQHRLKQTHRELTEQQAIEDRKLRELRNRLESQDARITRARESQRITEAEERGLRTRIGALGDEIRNLEFKLQAARTVSETGSGAQLEQELQSLRREAEQIETEISSLEE